LSGCRVLKILYGLRFLKNMRVVVRSSLNIQNGYLVTSWMMMTDENEICVPVLSPECRTKSQCKAS